VVFIYAVGCIGLQLVVWLVPSVVAGAVSLTVIGLLLGPMYPIAINQAGRVLPGWLLTGSIGVISGISVGGVACIPFVMGAIAEAAGIWVLQPFIVGLMAVLIVLWACVPRKR
jgi:fucose permease